MVLFPFVQRFLMKADFLLGGWWEPSALAEESNASALRTEFEFDHAR
jgi:hypothetical protein